MAPELFWRVFMETRRLAMAARLSPNQRIVNRDTDRPAWSELLGIVLVLALVMIGLAIANNFDPF